MASTAAPAPTPSSTVRSARNAQRKQAQATRKPGNSPGFPYAADCWRMEARKGVFRIEGACVAWTWSLPFIQNDELAEINKRMKANGGKAIESQLESIQRYGYSDDAQATLEQIQKEEEQSAQNRADAFSIGNQVAM